MEERKAVSFKRYLADICAKYEHFDLFFEFLGGENILEITQCFAGIKNKESLFKFFKSNPQLAIHYGTNISTYRLVDRMNLFQLKGHENVFEWIVSCIIYELPEDAYSGLFKAKPFIYKYLVPEAEYPKIHAALLRHYQEIENNESFEFYSLLNDIRFGDLTVLPSPLDSYDKGHCILLAQTAVLGNKRDLFMQIYDLMNGDALSFFLLMENVFASQGF